VPTSTLRRRALPRRRVARLGVARRRPRTHRRLIRALDARQLGHPIREQDGLAAEAADRAGGEQRIALLENWFSE
jgi:hypothetical protein